MDHKGPQQHGRHTVAGDAQGQQGDEGAADDCVVGGLGGHHAVHDPSAVLLRVLGGLFGGHPGENTGGGAPDAGQDTDAGTDEGGAQCVPLLPHELLPGESEALDFKALLDLSGLSHLFDLFSVGQHLRNGKDADQGRQDVKAGGQFVDTEGESLGSINGRHTHQGNDQAQAAGEQSLNHAGARQGGDHREGKEAHAEVLDGGKLQGNLRHGRGHEHKHQEGEQAAQEGEYHSGTQSLARLTLFGHGGAIEAGGDGGGGAGDVDEDGRDQAAGDPADVERHE